MRPSNRATTLLDLLSLLSLLSACGGSSDSSSTRPSASVAASVSPPSSASADASAVASSSSSAAPTPADLRPSVVAARKAEDEMLAKLALDSAGLALWKRAESAWVTYLLNDAGFMFTLVRDSGKAAHDNRNMGARPSSRIQMLNALLDKKEPARSAKETNDALLQGEDRLASTLRDAESKKLHAEAKNAWLTYRSEEKAFVRKALSKPLGGEENADKALDIALDQQRAVVVGEEYSAVRSD